MAVNLRQEAADSRYNYGGGKPGGTSLAGGNTVYAPGAGGADKINATQALSDIDKWNAAVGQIPAGSTTSVIGGGSGGSRRGGGGGGGGGVSAAKAKLLANQYFNFNAAPALMQIAAIRNQQQQAQNYNPNFQQMAQPYQQMAQQGYQQSNADAQAAMGQGQQFAQQQNTQMANTLGGQLRDLQGQGVENLNPYMSQAMPAMQGVGANNASQAQYMAALNAANQSGQADYTRQAGLLAQGGQAALANQRGTLMNQLGQQELGVEAQAAQQRQALDQQKMQFLLKYGIG